jgi:hypothetical protein
VQERPYFSTLQAYVSVPLLLRAVDAADVGSLLLAEAVGVDVDRSFGIEHLLEAGVRT